VAEIGVAHGHDAHCNTSGRGEETVDELVD
jgi:hypothetical protein